MGMPVATTVNGTGTFIYYPDWTISPFQVGIAVVTGTSGVNGTATVDVTFDKIDLGTLGTLGTAVASANWFNIVAATGANATANYTTPVQAIRFSVVTATATSLFVATFVQAGLPR